MLPGLGMRTPCGTQADMVGYSSGFPQQQKGSGPLGGGGGRNSAQVQQDGDLGTTGYPVDGSFGSLEASLYRFFFFPLASLSFPQKQHLPQHTDLGDPVGLENRRNLRRKTRQLLSGAGHRPGMSEPVVKGRWGLTPRGPQASGSESDPSAKFS